MNLSKRIIVTILTMLMVFSPLASYATVTSNAATVTVNATITQSLTLSVGPASITLPANGSASSPISVTESWDVSQAYTIFNYAYFSTTQALTSGANFIPAGDIVLTSSLGAGGFGPVAAYFDPNLTALAPSTAQAMSFTRPGSVAAGSGNFSTSFTLGDANLANGTYLPGTYSGTLNVVAFAE